MSVLPSKQCDRGVRRRTLIGRILGTGVALSTLASAAGASAASPSPLPGLSRALNNASSYQVDLTITGASSGKVTGTVVVLRHNGKNRAHLILNAPSGSGTATSLDAVIVGSRVCIKQSPSAPYQCVTSPAVAAEINLDPSNTFQRAGVSTAFTPAGSKIILGKLCNGYTFTITSKGARAHGTLYVNPTNGRPREEDVTTIATSSTTGKTTTLKTMALWSRYDDPTLTIPTVPAS